MTNIEIEKAQSLFEVVIAIGIAALVIVGVISLATTSIRNSSFSRNKTLASRYSQEAISRLRSERDNLGWDTFRNNADDCQNPADCCLRTLTWDPEGCLDPITDTILTREVSFICYQGGVPPEIDCNDSNVDTVQADVTTTWTDGQGDHEANASTQFTNWRTQ